MCPLCMATTASLVIGAVFSGAAIPLLARMPRASKPARQSECETETEIPSHKSRKETQPHA